MIALLAVALLGAAPPPPCTAIEPVTSPCVGLRGPSTVLRTWFRCVIVDLPRCQADARRDALLAAAAATAAAARVAACQRHVAALEAVVAPPPAARPLWPYVIAGAVGVAVGVGVGVLLAYLL